jgi:hypothetical protein
MIRKPPSDLYYAESRVEAARRFGDVGSRTLSNVSTGFNWLRALISIPICAAGALLSGWAAFAAGSIGGNIPMAIIALCCSLLMGWLALRSVRIVFGGTRSNRSGSGPGPYGASSGSWQEPWANNGQITRDTGTTSRGGESRICYSRTKLVLYPVMLFPLCLLLAFWLNSRLHGNINGNALVLASLILALLFGVRSMLMGVSGDLTAISWDDHEIRVRTLSSSRQVPWEAVEAIQIRLHVQRVLGFIPVYKKATGLVIRLRHNGSRRKMVIPAFPLSISPEAAAAMIQDAVLRRTRHRAAPRMPSHDVASPDVASHDVRGGDRPSFGRKIAAEPDLRTSEPNATTALDAVERTRALGDHDRIMVAPRAFGKKVV